MKINYVGNQGDFTVENPELLSYLYFPIANEAGVMSSVAPDLAGDNKMSQNSFLMSPVSCDNLHNDKSSRNVWVKLDGKNLWSLTGRSAAQQAQMFTEEKEPTLLEAGFMHHKITRESAVYGVKASLSSVAPSSGETLELLKVEITNTSEIPQKMQVVAAIPLYARSADNIRDHRHVTALLHRITTNETGVIVNPTMTFDERGHKQNTIQYGVFGANATETPIGYYPIIEDFIGEGGNLENPRALYENPLKPYAKGEGIDGYEALGGLVFEEKTVEPGETISYVVAMGYGSSAQELTEKANKFLSVEAFDRAWEETVSYWKEKVNVSYHTGSQDFDQWMKWVSFQPMLRRIYGCSFLPHHDYGKGGRGWRDLWQDCLALLIMNPSGVRQMLIDNFGGVRMDGTNATIIGSGQGEFIADRNGIARVWMDHGVWPFLTTELYINHTGDLDILMEENTYFKDLLICRGEQKDTDWESTQGEKQKDAAGNVYSGTLLEHLLIQNLASFYDVGEHNEIKLRGADWNDALDMANANGESVAFTTMYADNLAHISLLLEKFAERGVKTIKIAKEMEMLLATGKELYDSVSAKRDLLMKYCETCRHTLSGQKVEVEITALAANLKEKADWMREHIRQTEWVTTSAGDGFFNGYYDNSKQAVEGEVNGQVRMMLTSQVFSIMSKTATDEQVARIVKSADKYLYDPCVGGYRLNTNFHEVKMDLGRMFGFAYGHKENGAVFCHMATMFGNALYTRGFAKEAYKVFSTLFEHCNDVEKSRIYPGVPEYVDAKGRGVYHYLTGAASWLLVTVITQMFGVRGNLGDLEFAPQLLPEQFDEKGQAGLSMMFAGKSLKIVMTNEARKAPGEYQVHKIALDGKEYAAGMIARADIEALSDQVEHTVEVTLA
ncbi:MAG: GH36-type glycosyl hydrolase domain-containing protein [Wujia sp.]